MSAGKDMRSCREIPKKRLKRLLMKGIKKAKDIDVEFNIDVDIGFVERSMLGQLLTCYIYANIMRSGKFCVYFWKVLS